MPEANESIAPFTLLGGILYLNEFELLPGLSADACRDIGRLRRKAVSAHLTGDAHTVVSCARQINRVVEAGRKSVRTLLGELSDLGFSWRDIARMLHVSVPAIRKWRQGGAASGDSRRKVAALMGACNLIMRHSMVDEIASWFEMPLTSAPVTPIDLYAAGRADLVFDYASGHPDPERLMDEFDPQWRERYRSDFDVVTASDGDFSIVRKER